MGLDGADPQRGKGDPTHRSWTFLVSDRETRARSLDAFRRRLRPLEGARLLLLLALQPLAEAADALAHRAAELRQPLGSEHQQHDDEQNPYLQRSYAWH